MTDPAKQTDGPEPSATQMQTIRAVRAVAILSRQFERACVDMGLSLPQYRLLLWVRRGPQRAAELAARASVRRPTLTALVDGLEADGVLMRTAVEGDRRGIRLELTQKGVDLLARTESHLAHLLDQLVQIGGQERDEIVRNVALLGQAMEQALEKRYRDAAGVKPAP